MDRASPQQRSLAADTHRQRPDAAPSHATAISAGATGYPFLLPPVEADEIGRLGNYRVLGLLGKGGMGLVFHAEDIALGRPVALKVLRPELQAVAGWQRFLREARMMAAIKHEHLVTIYQAGQENGVVYFAMELLEGESLYDWIRRTPEPDLAEAVRIGRDIADGLAVLHRKGLIHRDIKPGNLWLESPSGHVIILDLGLARVVPEEAESASAPLADDTEPLTQAGVAVGTPGFMAPEQALGEALDARADLFSLGCVLYRLCTGHDPFDGSNPVSQVLALAHPPTHPRELNPTLPAPLAELVMKLLATDPARRPASAEAVRDLLERIGRGLSAPPSATEVVPIVAVKKKKTRKLKPTPPSARRRLLIPALILAGITTLLVIGTLTGVTAWYVVHAATPAAPASAFLSDLPEVGRENWPFLPPPHPNGEQPGKVIRMAGQVSPHGIFMHPAREPGSAASVSYRLGKQYATFESRVGVNDGPARPVAPCNFAVYGDGKLLWKSRPVLRPEDMQECSVPVNGVDVLRIAVTCEGPAQGAHVAWAEPRVAR